MITCAYIPNDFESFYFLDGVVFTHAHTHTTNNIQLSSAQLRLNSIQLNVNIILHVQAYKLYKCTGVQKRTGRTGENKTRAISYCKLWISHLILVTGNILQICIPTEQYTMYMYIFIYIYINVYVDLYI